MIELNFRATPLLKAHKQLDCTNYAQISEIWCKINYSVGLGEVNWIKLSLARESKLVLMSFELLRILNEVPLVEQIDEVAVFVLTSKSLGAVELWLKLQFCQRKLGVGVAPVEHVDQFPSTLLLFCKLALYLSQIKRIRCNCQGSGLVASVRLHAHFWARASFASRAPRS